MSILWTKSEIKYLVDNRATKTNKELSRELGKSYHSIYSQSKRMGLKYNREDRSAKEYVAKPKRITDPWAKRKAFATAKGFKNVSDCVFSYGTSAKFIEAFNRYQLEQMEVVLN